jgi:hypothetical protein
MAAFTPGNLVIYRVGTGTGALGSTGTAVFLDEYTPTGTLVQSIAMPTADAGSNQTLTASGSSTSEGLLDLSSDGRYLILTGYDTPVGGQTSGATSSTVARVIGRVDATGAIDTTTALNAFSGGNIRGATSTDGTTFWATSNNAGILTTTLGSTTGTIISNTPSNLRGVDIFADQLYISASTGTTRIATVGSGTPTTSGQTIANIPGGPTTGSPYQFVFLDLSADVPGVDTLYYSDDGVGTAPPPAGIYKYTLSGGTWVADGFVAAASVRGLTASVSGSTVSLYATSATNLYFLSDPSGYDGTLTGTVVSRATASTNTAFRGIDFAPQAAAPALPTLNISDVTQAEGTTPGTTDFTFSVTLTAPAGPGGVTFDIATADGTAQDDNPATEDNDYVAQALTGQHIPAGSTGPFNFTVTVNNDNIREGNETFFVNVTNVVGATVGDGQGTGTLTDDDTPVLSIADVSQAEGNAGTSVLTFTVSLNQPAPFGGVTFDIATADNTATDADNDYEPRTLTTQTIAEGQSSYTFDVTVNGDTVFEAHELFLVNVTNVTSASVGDGQATGTINNDDAAPVGTFSIDDVTHNEGDSGTTNYLFTVSRTGGSAGAATVQYSIAAPGGAGIADSADFAAGGVFAGTLSFADGETSKTISIDVQGDTAVEPTETFTVTLSNATGGASIADNSGTGTITNDDALPPAGGVSIADAQIIEGNSGTSLLVLTLTRSGGTGAFDVNYATSNGGTPGHASATAGSDYVAQSGTVSFATGEDVKTVSITINGDTTPELSEEFTVTLSGATNGATIDDSAAIATITNDDAPSGVVSLLNETFDAFRAAGFAPNPTAGQFDSDVYIASGFDDAANPSVDYGDTVTTGDLARGVTTVAVTTGGIYALDQTGGDYAFLVQPGANDFTPGDFTIRIANTSGVAADTFSVAYDLLVRNDQGRSNSFNLSYSTDGTNFLALTAFNYTSPAAADALGLVTIARSGEFTTGSPVAAGGFLYLRLTGDDVGGSGSRDEFGLDNFSVGAVAGVATPQVSVSDVSVNEAAGTMTFTVTRSNVVGGAFSVDYATANGSATAGADYGATSGTLTFADNQVSATVTVTINDDATPELDETVLLNLSNASGATIVDAQGVGTILNDDGTPIQVSIGDASVVEGDSGSVNLVFTLTRTGGTGAFDVNFQTVDVTATSTGPGQDYVTTSGTVNFAAGQNTATISVPVLGDTAAESNETFQVQLISATNDAVIVDNLAVGTIVNDEPTFIHDIQGTSYYSPILAGEGKTAFNVASTTVVTIRGIVTAVDNVGDRQGYYITEESSDWDSNPFTSEGIFVMTRRDDGTTGVVVSGVTVGDLVQVSAQVMEYQSFSSMPRTVLVNPTGLSVITQGNSLTSITPVLTNMRNEVMTDVTPDYTDSSDGAGDTFDASVYALSYFETVEGMLVTIPNMVVADGFVSTSGGDPYFKAYSLDSANADQINSRGGYTIAGDPPIGPPDTATTGDDTNFDGRVLHDGDVNPDIIEVDFTDFAMSPPAGLLENATMGDPLGDVTGIVDFDFTDLKLFVTAMEPGGFVNAGKPVQEVTALGADDRALTVATFNVENLDPTDGAARFAALANAIANNLNSPDIITIEEMQDNNGAAAGDGSSATGTDASVTWQMLVDALNLATGAHYQWVDELPVYNAEGGEQSGNIRVGFLYNTDRVQLGNLEPDATLAERRMYTDRIGDGVRDAGDQIAFSDNMVGGEISAADWAGTRRSLLGEFTFHGNKVYVTANHFPSKGGSGEFWQLNQNVTGGQPENSDMQKRSTVAQDVYAVLNHIQGAAPAAGIVAGGDFNDFYFYRPMTTVTGYTMADGTARSGGARFDNLTLTLPEAERYTYTFDGRSQAIDHIIANGMLSAVATYDVVHLNTGYNSRGTGADADPSLSDHEPAVASFDFRSLNETLVGTPQADFFVLDQGGDDNVSGGDGNDVFLFGATMTSADQVQGGNGIDQVALQGDYSAGLTFGANVLGIENLAIMTGSDTRFGDPGTNFYDYNLTLLDVNVAAGVQMVIDANRLRLNEDFTFNGSAETDGSFFIFGGGGTDKLTGGANNDVFLFGAQGQWGSPDVLTGGGGIDQLSLRGDYTVTFGAAQLVSIEQIAMVSAFDTRFGVLGDTYDYNLTMNDGNVDGIQMMVDAAMLRSNETLAFNGSAEDDGSFRVFGGTGNDVIVGGQLGDIIVGNLGADTLTGGAGGDTFVYRSKDDSPAGGDRDAIQDFDIADIMDLTQVDAINGGADDAFTFIGTENFHNVAGELRATVSSGPIWLVQGDTDGDGDADLEFFVTITNNGPITSGDFML